MMNTHNDAMMDRAEDEMDKLQAIIEDRNEAIRYLQEAMEAMKKDRSQLSDEVVAAEALLRTRITDLESQLQVAENAHRAANEQMLQAWRDRDEAREAAKSLYRSVNQGQWIYLAENYASIYPWLRGEHY
jgi:chromosome segregation ATPase